MKKHITFLLAVITILLASCTTIDQTNEQPENSQKPERTETEPFNASDNEAQPLDFKYTIIRFDIDFDTYEDFELTESESEELDKLLHKDKWEIAVDLPEMGYMGGEGNDSVSLSDKYKNTAFLVKEKIGDEWVTLIIAKNTDDPDSVVNYLAPIDVIEDAIQFANRVKQAQ